MDEFPKNLIEFTNRFKTVEDCSRYLAQVRWPAGFICPKCKSNKGWTTYRETIYCSSCEKQTSVRAGTALHKTHLSIQTWFMAIWLLCTQKTGLSAYDLQRELGLGSYRTAWLLLHKLRSAMICAGRDPLKGDVEVDEAYYGLDEPGIIGRRIVNKSLIAVAVEIEGNKVGRIRLGCIKDASSESLGAFIKNSVEAGSTVTTDGWSGYSSVNKLGYNHYVIPSKEKDLTGLLPHVHLVISLLKRWMRGTLQGNVSKKHLHKYLDEFVFRFNRRKSRHIGKIFHRVVEQLVIKKPSSYKEIVS